MAERILLVSIPLIFLLCLSNADSNSKCPSFDKSNCAKGVEGMIDPGNYRWKKYLSGRTTKLTKGYCANYCDMTENCTFWSFCEATNDEDDLCYMYDDSGCDPFEVKGEQKLPYISKTDNSDFNHTTGQVCDTLRHEKPSVKGDPHFTGADNSQFDFTGKPGNTYCLLSDAHVHINAYYGGRFDRWGSNPRKPLTWIRQLGILWGHHTIHVAAREGAEWRYRRGYIRSIAVDGEEAILSQAGDSASFLDEKIKLRWVRADKREQVDMYEIEIHSVLLVRIAIHPEIPFLRTRLDGVVHMNVELLYVRVSDHVHGVLGQTFRSDHAQKTSRFVDPKTKMKVVPGDNAEGFLDGKVSDYVSSSLLRSDCFFSRFYRADSVDSETSRAIERSSRVSVVSTGKQEFKRVLIN